MDLIQGYSDAEDSAGEEPEVIFGHDDLISEDKNISKVTEDMNAQNVNELVEEDDNSEYGPKPSKSASNSDDDAVPENSVDMTLSIDKYSEIKQIPIANEIKLGGHTKAVTCLSIEPAGNRVVTGSLDYLVKLYDFGGMDSRHKAFYSMEPQDSQPVIAISHSPSGDRFAVATSSAQVKVFDRDGKAIITFVKGDMYLRDLLHTKGHTMSVTGLQWHPTEKNTILTSSLDGSLRIWDLLGEAAFGNLINQHVLRVKGSAATAQRLAANCCYYSATGGKIIGGASDGSIHIWKSKKFYDRPDFVLKHETCSGVAVLQVNSSPDEAFLVARYENSSAILWDLKTCQRLPIKVIHDVANLYQTANVAFSPDSSLFCCCSSPSREEAATAGEGKSKLLFFDTTKENLTPRLSITVQTGGGSGICVKWQVSTNQLFCSLSTGEVKVFYDAAMTKGGRKGALLSAAKAPKREKDPSDFTAIGEIYNPMALPMYRLDPHSKNKKRKQDLTNPAIAKIPEKPTKQGPGMRENTSFFFTNFVMNGRTVDNARTEDPRAALLALDEVTKSDPKFLGRAYQNSQPINLLHKLSAEEEQEEFKKRQKTSIN